MGNIHNYATIYLVILSAIIHGQWHPQVSEGHSPSTLICLDFSHSIIYWNTSVIIHKYFKGKMLQTREKMSGRHAPFRAQKPLNGAHSDSK